MTAGAPDLGEAVAVAPALPLKSAVLLVVANMVGAGVFTTSGFAMADLGDARLVLLAWVVGGGVALLGALSYGALARAIPLSGGEYTYLRHTVHPWAGVAAGWVSLLAGFTAPIAAAALLLSAYLSLGDGLLGKAAASAVIVVAGLLHGMKTRSGVVAQDAAVVLKLIAIAAFIAAGAWLSPGTSAPVLAAIADTRSPLDLVEAFAVTLVWIGFSYSGWNAATYVAAEVEDPRRNLNRSLLIATSLVTVVYVALNAVFLFSAPPQALAGQANIGAVAAEALGGPPLRHALSALVVLALFTSISSMVMAGPRVYGRMAQDGVLPGIFRRKASAPRWSIGLQVALAVAFTWLASLRELIGFIGFTLSISAAATVIGLMLHRRRLGPARVPVPLYPWVPLSFVVVTLSSAAFMASRQPTAVLVGLALVGLALVITARRRRVRPTGSQ